MSTETLGEAVLVVSKVKNYGLLHKIMNEHRADDPMTDVEDFVEMASVFGLSEECAKELWQPASEVRNLTYSGAMYIFARSLTDGPCSYCKGRPMEKGNETVN